MNDNDIIESNQLKVSKEERQLVETFMGYADLYLSQFVRWNDVMLVVEKIESLGFRGGTINHCKIRQGRLLMADTLSYVSEINAVWKCCIDFIKWYSKKYK